MFDIILESHHNFNVPPLTTKTGGYFLLKGTSQ